MRSAHGLVLGILLAAGAVGVRAQGPPSAQAPANPGTPAKKPAAPTAKPTGQAPAPAKPATPAAKPAGQAPTGAGKPAGKPAAQAPAKSTPKTSATPAKPGKGGGKPGAKKRAKTKAKAPKSPKKAAKPKAVQSEIRVARRDPFESLIGRQRNASEGKANLPPGKAGLQVSTLRLDGVVRAPNGMIAVVTNPQSRTYFLREGDQLYDGRVEKITMEGVSFHEMGKDAFGKPVEREVNKRMYSTGEQQ